MRILIKRTYLRGDCTIGFLWVDGRYFCDTLEPHAIPWVSNPFIGQKAEKRKAGKTAIPEGSYKVVLADSKTHRRVMPFLQHVPEFKKVALRFGKRPKDTRCDVLVGKLDGYAETPLLKDSVSCFHELFHLMEEALEKGEEIEVTIHSYKEWRYRRKVHEERDSLPGDRPLGV